MNDKDTQILRHIIEYCNNIENSILRYGDSLCIFENDVDYFQSISMSILQIGELSINLSEEFKSLHNNIPWTGIRGMRNIFAHKYGKIKKDVVWGIVKEDIPVLSSFCKKYAK
ncbi:MAG: DUF86 domain-containing protein [Lachnospiraceae bacterium]|nr:DUF86 domain-containing protein [Lachnospiraceae bacterium]